MDIYSGFKWNLYDAKVGKEIIKREATPEAITYFSYVCDDLTDYGYWFYLSTLWVSYTGHSDINLWRKLFGSGRPKRSQCIMKPSELKKYKQLPYFVKAYRAHRTNEKDWIAYTLDPTTAARFATERGVDKVSEYRIKKRDIIALFLRRGEDEIIVLKTSNIEFVRELDVVVEDQTKGVKINDKKA